MNGDAMRSWMIVLRCSVDSPCLMAAFRLESAVYRLTNLDLPSREEQSTRQSHRHFSA
jgi:hypothetical protein